MKFKPIIKYIGLIVICSAALVALMAIAMFLSESRRTAAKASSISTKIELEQSFRSDTQTLNDRIRQASQQNEAEQAVSNITYFSDPRTSLCFAYLNVYDSYGATRSITTVNCGFVPRDLLITVKK